MRIAFKTWNLFLSALLILMLADPGRAKSRKTLMTGANVSYMFTSNSAPKPGVSFGFGKEWRVPKHLRLGVEWTMSSRRARLTNKKILYYPGAIVEYNISCSYVFIETPILIKYYFPMSELFQFSIFTGPSISVGISDTSTRERPPGGLIIRDWETEKLKNVTPDYHDIEDPGPVVLNKIFNSFFGFNFGATIESSHYFFSIRGHYSMIWTAGTKYSLIELQENYITLHFVMGIIWN